MAALKKEVFELLKQTKYTKSSRRKNINKNVPPQTMIMGYRTWFGNHGLAAASLKYPLLYKKLKELMKKKDPNFKFTTITLNKNFKCEPHRDGENVGVSYIIGFGDYKKGELNVEGKKIDIHNKFYKFNGSLKTHFVEPWTSGDRYTIVYYNRTNW